MPLPTVVTYSGVIPSRRAIYCVSPQDTVWDAQHLNASVVAGTALKTPVLLDDTVQVKQVPAWLAWVFDPVAFTVPGTIFIGRNTPYIPAELLTHEMVHRFRAQQQGAFRYFWSVIRGWFVGAKEVLAHGGHIHDHSPVEIEARQCAQAICSQYSGDYTPLDAPAQIAAYFAGSK